METIQLKKVTSLTELKRNREILATGPSGNIYKIRPINLERHALSGGLPSRLREIAMQGADGVNNILTGTNEEIEERGGEAIAYLDSLVCKVIVEPVVTPEVLEFIPPVDYRWAVNIAMGEEDRDGEGRKLWGREPISAWASFRTEHNCPKDCASCERLRRSAAEVQ